MSTPAPEALPELLTADDDRVRACTADGVDHDYRPYTVTLLGKPVLIVPKVANPMAPALAELEAAKPIGTTVPGTRTFLRCVWCHGVTCGDADETDPCIEPYHHRVDHRTRLGTTWPKGGDRPDPTPKGARP